MADLERMQRALIAAHEAGDTENAQILAKAIKGYKEEDNRDFITKYSDKNFSPDTQQVVDALNPIRMAKAIPSALEGVARTAGNVAGSIPQGLRALGEYAFSDADVGTALQRSEGSNPMVHVPGSSKGKAAEEMLGHAFSTVVEATGKGAENLLGPDERDLEYLRKHGGEKAVQAAINASQATRTTAETAANFAPIPGAKAVSKVASKLARTELPREPMLAEKAAPVLPERPMAPEGSMPRIEEPIPPHIEEAATRPEALPQLPEAPEAIQARIQQQMDQMNGLPEYAPKPEIAPESPLPKVTMLRDGEVPYDGLSLAEKGPLDNSNIGPQMPNAGAPRMPIETLQHNMVKEKMQRMVEERAAMEEQLSFLRKMSDPAAYDHAASQGTVPTRESLPLRISELRQKIGDLERQMTEYTSEKGINTKEDALGLRKIYDTTQPVEGGNTVQKTPTYNLGAHDYRPSSRAAERSEATSNNLVTSATEPTAPTAAVKAPEKPITTEAPKESTFWKPLGDSPALKELNSLFTPKKESGGVLEVNKGERAANAVKNIPGLKDSPWTPVPSDPKALLDYVRKGTDISNDLLGKFRNLSASGLKGITALTRNPVLKTTYQAIDGAVARATKLERDLLVNDLKPAFDKLNFKEIQDVWQAIQTGLSKTEWTPEQLKEAGLNERQVNAYQAFRRVMDRTHEIINETLVSQGKEPIPKHVAYAASKWVGDYKGYVYDTKGKLLYVISETTRRQANKALEYISKNAEGLDLDTKSLKIDYEPPGSKKPMDFAELGYLEMMKMLDKDDPRVQHLESIKEDYDAQRTFDSFAFKNHLKMKTGVGGAAGFKPWANEKTNTKQGLNAQIKYVEQAVRWSEYQKSLEQLKEVLNDKELGESQPNAVKLAKEKVKDLLGYGDNEIGRGIDTLIKKLSGEAGISSGSFAAVRDSLKSVMYAKFFALNPMFWAVQGLQAIFAVPQVLRNGSMSHFMPALADTTKAILEQKKGKMSPDTEAALKYATDYDIAKDTFQSDIRDLTKNEATQVLDKVSNFGAKQIESSTRLVTYMNFFHMFRRAGMDVETATKTAGNLTNHTMVDYRPHEMPRFYQNLGMIGKSASSLRMFTHNQWTQLVEMIKYTKTEKDVAPLMALLGLQLGVAGTLGFYGVDEVDRIARFLKGHGLYNGNTPKEYMLKNWNDLVNFGGVSKLTGLDFSSRLSAGNPIPDGMVEAFAPLLSDAVKSAVSVGAYMANPNEITGMQALHQNAPSGLKGLVEQGFTQPDGRILDPNDPTKMLRRRTDFEKDARLIGARAVSESKDANISSQIRQTEAQLTTLRKEALEKLAISFTAGNREQMKKHIETYLKYGGDPQTLETHLKKVAMDQHMDRRQRAVGIPGNSVGSVKRTQRALEYEE